MKTIHFNTGRLYTVDGQRITATLHDDGVVTFMDHSRGIDGEFQILNLPFNRDTVMSVYDHNLLGRSQRSWADGMLRDGCNRWKEEG